MASAANMGLLVCLCFTVASYRTASEQPAASPVPDSSRAWPRRSFPADFGEGRRGTHVLREAQAHLLVIAGLEDGGVGLVDQPALQRRLDLLDDAQDHVADGAGRVAADP